MEINKIYCGDCIDVLRSFPDECIDCCVTSPPYYGLRDYGVDGQIGLEETPQEYIDSLVDVFREVKRVLKENGTLWLNIGDSYCNSNGYERASEQFIRKGRSNALANDRNLKNLHNEGFKTKDLMGIPWMLAFALREDGWYLRQDIIWAKPNPMPESVKDRCTKSHEYIFLLSKSQKYYFDNEAIQEDAVCKNDRRKDSGRIEYNGKYDGENNTMSQQAFVSIKDKRNKRDVWTVSTKANKYAHFATYPEELIEPCVLAGCPAGGVILDPFFGSGTTGRVATKYGRNYVGIELNPEYVQIATRRTTDVQAALF